MKVLQFIFLTICAILETGLFIFSLLGVFARLSDPTMDVPIVMILAFLACAIAMLVITVRSFNKLARDRENPVLQGFLFKFPLLIFTLGISWFALDIPEAGCIAVVMAIMLGALVIFLPKISEKNKNTKRATKLTTTEFQFTKDKAEWAWEDAAEEYRRVYGKTAVKASDVEKLPSGGTEIGTTGSPKQAEAEQEYTDEETMKIFDYAAMPIAYFVGWLVRKNLVSDEFRQTHGGEVIRDLKDEKLTPVDFLAGDMDYVFTRDDVAPEAQRFVDIYYRDELAPIPFSHRSRRYFFDYYKVICSEYDSPRYYCVDFTWEKFHRLAEVLDLRYRDFMSEEPDWDGAEAKAVLKGQYWGTPAELFVEPGTMPSYAQKCTDAFEHMTEGLQQEIADCLIEYYTGTEPTEPSVEWILGHMSPSRVEVVKPDPGVCGCKALYGSHAADEPFGVLAGGAATSAAAKKNAVPAYVVRGESEWDPEHGISFTVIGDHVVDFGGYADAMSPCSEDLQWRYRILEDASRGNYCAAEVIPARFGGRADAADNQVVVPKAAAALKEHYEDLVEALYIMKRVEHYDCKITYENGRPNYLFLEATAGDRRTFRDSISLGNFQ